MFCAKIYQTQNILPAPKSNAISHAKMDSPTAMVPSKMAAKQTPMRTLTIVVPAVLSAPTVALKETVKAAPRALSKLKLEASTWAQMPMDLDTQKMKLCTKFG